MSEKIKVITFNLRLASKHDGVNYFDYRLPRIIEFLKAEKPDVIGFQEVNEHMKELLTQNIDDYILIGCGRDKDYSGESAPIGYRKDRFELIKFENFWLSTTPDLPGSRYGFDQSATNPRITSAALLKHRSGGSPFWFINTHLDHRGNMARLFGAMQILQFMSTKKEPAILVGDFNAAPDAPEIKLIIDNPNYPMTDCTEGLGGTFHAYSDKPLDRIDYIFTTLKCDLSQSVVYPDEPVDGVYMSDHRPVGAVVEIE